MANAERIHHVVAHIEQIASSPTRRDEHGNYWDQTQWISGYSFLGWRRLFSEPAQERLPNVCGSGMCAAGWTLYLYREEAAKIIAAAPRHHISGVAQKILGLTNHQASDFFQTTNDLADLRKMAETFTQAGS